MSLFKKKPTKEEIEAERLAIIEESNAYMEKVHRLDRITAEYGISEDYITDLEGEDLQALLDMSEEDQRAYFENLLY